MWLGTAVIGRGDQVMAFFYLLYEFFLEDLQIFISLIWCLLYLFEMHVKSLGVTLDFLDTLDDLFLKDLLPFFHLVDFTVERLIFRRWWCTASIFSRGWLKSASSTMKSRTAFSHWMIICKVLMILILRGNTLGLIVLYTFSAIWVHIILYLWLIFIAFDHLL